jgi:hypothetical protein
LWDKEKFIHLEASSELPISKILIKLDEEVAMLFHDDKSVNNALHILINIAKRSFASYFKARANARAEKI